MSQAQPDPLTAGRIYNLTISLTADAKTAFSALPLEEQGRIALLPFDAREAEIAALLMPAKPDATPKQKGK